MNILSEAKQFPYVFTLISNCKRLYNALSREGQFDFSVRLISSIIPEKCNDNVPYYGTPISVQYPNFIDPAYHIKLQL